MNPLPHKYQILLVTIISLGILFLPACSFFYRLSEVDFLCSTLTWENTDDEDQGVNFQEKGKTPEIDFFSSLFVINKKIFKESLLLSSQKSLSMEEASVLRC